MAWHRRSRRSPGTSRLWVSLALLTLPGWRVPGHQVVTAGGVRCPYGHGVQEVENGNSARCEDCPMGWFQWAPCPRGDQRIASVDGTKWRCHAEESHQFTARMCPDGRFVGLPQQDGTWRCTGAGEHKFWAAEHRCGACRFGIPVIYVGAARWVCPACGLSEDRRGD